MLIRQLSNTKSSSSIGDQFDSDLDLNIGNGDERPRCPFVQSVRMCHKAVNGDPSNGQAWSALANALLTNFFKNFGFIAMPINDCYQSKSLVKESESNFGLGPKTEAQLVMKRCLAAYKQAAKDLRTALEPNFHYNRGLAWHYQVYIVVFATLIISRLSRSHPYLLG